MKKQIAVLMLMMVGVLSAAPAHAGIIQDFLGITDLQNEVGVLQTQQSETAASVGLISSVLDNIVLYGGLLLGACTLYVATQVGKRGITAISSAKTRYQTWAAMRAANKIAKLEGQLAVEKQKVTMFGKIRSVAVTVGSNPILTTLLLTYAAGIGFAYMYFEAISVDAAVYSLLAGLPTIAAIHWTVNKVRGPKITIKEQQLGQPLNAAPEVDVDALARAMKENALADADHGPTAAAI